MNRDLSDLLRQVREKGCTVVLSRRGGHYKVYVPGGGLVVFACTPSDWRAVLNIRADLRKAGLDI